MPHEHPQKLTSVTNALRMLKLFTVQTPDKRLSELARELGIGKSTANRLLYTLLSEGFVYQDPLSLKYRLGNRIPELYNVMMTTYSDLVEIGKPPLLRLANKFPYTLYVAIIEENEVIYLEEIKPYNRNTFETYKRKREPVHCTSSGKMLLANLNDYQINQALKQPLTRFTSLTVTDPVELKEQLTGIREQNYCLSMGEYEKETFQISTPLRDVTGQAISVLTAIGSMNQLSETQLNELISELKKTAKEISRQIGYVK